ncbi:MAG: hypothetical protein IJR83_06695 [Clostridia bacterium]|nr:hypothetical protein [Clostridia bacterium]
MNNSQFYPNNPAPSAAPSNSGQETAALILGIASCVTGWCCCPFIAPVLSIIGIVMACMSRRDGRFSGKALAGLICSIAGLVGAVISFIIYIMSPQIYAALIEYLRALGYDVDSIIGTETGA